MMEVPPTTPTPPTPLDSTPPPPPPPRRHYPRRHPLTDEKILGISVKREIQRLRDVVWLYSIGVLVAGAMIACLALFIVLSIKVDQTAVASFLGVLTGIAVIFCIFSAMRCWYASSALGDYTVIEDVEAAETAAAAAGGERMQVR